MGQIKALFYKNWQLTKKQKGSFCCQVISPLICLGLIKLLLYLVSKAKINVNAMTEDGVIPETIYPCNLLTPRWETFFEDLYGLMYPKRIYRWSAENDQVKEAFEFWISRQPGMFGFYMFNDVGQTQLNPIWNYFPEGNTLALNNQLIRDIKELNKLDKYELEQSSVLPDSSLLVKSISPEYGVSADIQVNNIIYNRYHRKNGDSMYNVKDFDPNNIQKGDDRRRTWGSGKVLIASTESSIGHINLFSNMYLQSIFNDDLVNILAVISPTIDQGYILEFFSMALSIIIINLFPIALCLGFPLMLFVLVLEKEQRIKDLLDVNGLVTLNYWGAFLLYNFIILEIVTGAFLFIGYRYVNIDFFAQTPIWINLYFLSLWNLAQIGFALFCSSYLERTTGATLIGYTSSLFFVSFLCIVSQLLFPNPARVFTVFYLLPQTPFVRFFYLGISKCIDFKCYNSLSDLMEGEMAVVMLSMHFCVVFYFVTGLILNESKFRKMLKIDKAMDYLNSILFEDKSQKLKYLRARSSGSEPDIVTRGEEEEKHISAINYERKILESSLENDPETILVAKGMTKSFDCSQGTKVALNNFSLKIERGKIFGLLGPNGAGKTTFLSIATNIQDSDEGMCWIDGNRTDDRTLHSGNIGFCPQFDILWPQLNVLQHLIFLGMFKGMSKQEAKESAEGLIKEVDLGEDYKKKARQLSGGMKRRCSLAMALTGTPKIIFLDEPSSGLDPVKRRHFWQLIKRVTENKAVLITTHLMEEADTLCNEIGVITTGKLRCVGNSVYLKSQFTEGVKIQIVLKKGHREQEKIEEFILKMENMINGFCLQEVSNGALRVIVKNRRVSFSELFDAMTKEEVMEVVEDWSLSLGSLEDVFLAVVKTYRESNIIT